ncbi:MAG TPA: T9SS type A sorting domain-containing protein [Chitinophagaceae bacterium]|nr:T9SS type A sorting domain-containing protein [Chitinophagaceae bacterium]
MKRILIVLASCYCAQAAAQSNGLPPVNVHQVNIAIGQAGAFNAYSIAGAEQLANRRLTCVPNSCQSTLPVKWLLFDGNRLNEALVNLKWQTANEINNSGFEVERSLGNSSHFEKIAFVPAHAGSTVIRNYYLDDVNDYSGVSYYRLKQIDIDGRYTYSLMVAVKGYPRNTDLTLYPNPVQDMLHLSFEMPVNASAIVTVYDVSGRPVLQQKMQFKKGINVKHIAVAALIPGVYLVKLEAANHAVHSARFIKQP